MGVTRREAFVVCVASLVALAACGSDVAKAVPPSPTFDDDPIIDLTTQPAATSPATAAPTTRASTAPVDTSPAPSQPHDISAATEAQPTTSAPAPTTPKAAQPLAAQPLPKEGTERYVELGTIRIPAIGVDMPLGEGVTLTNLNKGPGHWPGTAMPGEVGNCVIGGHRVSHTHPFQDLDNLHPGDTITMNVVAGSFTYHVVSSEIVLPSAVRILDQTDDATGTLFACNPKGKTTQRIVIHLQLAPTQA